MNWSDLRREHQQRFESLVLAYDSALMRANSPAEARLEADARPEADSNPEPDARPEVEGAAEPSAGEPLPEPVQARVRAAQVTLRLLEQARLKDLTARSLSPATPLLEAMDPQSAIELPTIAGQLVGRFEIERELGRGGCGVVFLARDPDVGRRVALKVPRPEVLISRGARQRFLREAKAAGALSHPNVVGVYEVGEDGPLCYIASEFCDGPTLECWLENSADGAQPNDAARLVELLARAVEHAHQRGVLHRDIKPSNILLSLGSEGTGRSLQDYNPRLTDFGLAKLVELADDETRSGALLGTPAYMAPEQAEGRVRDIGPATDVYALGVILYELLAGRPPFRGASDVQTLQLVSRCEVPRLPRRRPAIGRDLRAIVFKCLEREPAVRYGSAGALADDLRRYLQGEPTLARPPRPAERLWKWSRRRPAVATLSAIMAAAVLLTSVGGWWYSARLSRALAQVETVEESHQRTLYVANVDRARRAIDMGQDQVARELLLRCRPLPGEPDLREFAWRYAWRQLNDELTSLSGHQGDVYCVTYSPDGRLLASSSQDCTARLWEVASGKCLHVLEGHSGDVNGVAFSADGQRVATADGQGTVRIWQVPTGTLLRKFVAHRGEAFGVAFSPNDAQLATCGEDGHVNLWSTQDGSQLATHSEHKGPVVGLSFSSDGSLLATAGDDERVILWDVSTRQVVRRLVHGTKVSAVAFDHSGKQFLAAARGKRQAWLWQAIDEFQGATPQFSQVVHAVGFNVSDNQFAVGTKDGILELFETSTRRSVQRFRGHSDRIWSLSFSPDAQHLATGSADRTIKIWRLPKVQGIQSPEGLGQVRSLSTDDGRGLLARGDSQANVEIVDLTDGHVVRSIPLERRVVGDFDGDGTLESGTYQAGNWRLEESQMADPDGKQPAEPLCVAFGTADDVPVVADFDADGKDDLALFRAPATWFINRAGEIKVSELDPRKVSKLWKRTVPLAGEWTRAGIDRPGLAVFDVPTNRWILLLDCRSSVARLDTSCQEEWAVPIGGHWPGAAGDAVGLLGSEGLWVERFHGRSLNSAVARARKDNSSLWQTPREAQFTRADRTEFDERMLDAAEDRARNGGFGTTVRSLALAPDGQQVAMALEYDYRVKVWDVNSGQRLAQIRLESSKVSQVAYSPDGQTLTIGSEDGTLWFHRAVDSGLRKKLRAHDRLETFKYSTDGRYLATVGDVNKVRVWDRQQHLLHTLEHDAETIEDVAISPDSQVVVSVGDRRQVHVWDLASGELIAGMSGHEGTISTVAFSPDGRTVVTGDLSGYIKLWDLKTRQELYTVAALGVPVRAVTFSPDGQDLIAGSHTTASGKVLHVWSTRPASLVRPQ